MVRSWMNRVASSLRAGNRYKKSLILLLIIACLPSTLVGIGFYFIGTRQVEQEVMKEHQSRLDQARKRMDDQFSHIERSVTNWALTPLFQNKEDLYRQFLTTQDIHKLLFVMKGSSTLIDQVYLYLEDQRFLISYDVGLTPLHEAQNAEIQSLLQDKKGMFWGTVPMGASKHAIALICRLPGFGDGFGALIFMLDETNIHNLVKELSKDQEGLSFIVDQNGDWVVAGTVEGNDRAGQAEFLREEVMKRRTDHDSFFVKWKHDTLSVSFNQIPRLQSTWIYVTASPVDHLVAPVQLMSKMIVLVSGMGIAAAIILSWIGSRRLYSPIRRLANLFKEHGQRVITNGEDEFAFIEKQWQFLLGESHELQERMEKQLPALREVFFLQLVQGNLSAFSEVQLRERLLQFGWDTEDRYFTVLVVQLASLYNPEGKFLEKDRQLVTFAASNIIEELAEDQWGDTAILNFQDLTIGLLLAFPIDRHPHTLKSHLFKLADHITEKLNVLLKLNVVIGIGRSVNFIHDLPAALQAVRQLMQYRTVEESNQILDIDEFIPQSTEISCYPDQLDKEIDLSLRRGDGSEAKRLIEQFFRTLSEQNVTEFIFLQSAHYLLGHILQTFAQMGFNIHSLYNGKNLYEQLIRMRDFAEIQTWFQDKVVEPYANEFMESRNDQSKKWVQLTIDMIYADYANDISLGHCAERLGVHPVRLSKVFKHITGLTFVDFLTKTRFDKAKELLRQTDMKINDISEMVGYQPTYFNKIFKKREGITAGEYRSLHTE